MRPQTSTVRESTRRDRTARFASIQPPIAIGVEPFVAEPIDAQSQEVKDEMPIDKLTLADVIANLQRVNKVMEVMATHIDDLQ